MRKILLGLILTGFALIVFISVGPQANNFFVHPEAPAVDPSEGQLSFEPAAYFSVVQGGSAPTLTVTNSFSVEVSFSLAHEHAHLELQPQAGKLSPGSSKEIIVYVDPDCPTGEIKLPVYLRAEIDGERIGMETNVFMNVTPGELSLKWQGNTIEVFLNDEPAPRGALISYRSPDEEDWKVWGETPRLDPSAHLEPGDYEIELRAILGSVKSVIETFYISVKTVEGKTIAEKGAPVEQPEKTASSALAATSAEPAQPARAPDPPRPREPESWEPHLTPVRPGYTAYKLEISGKPVSGKFYFKNLEIRPGNNSPFLPEDAYVRVTINRDGLGQYLDWSANVRIREVVVSGGPVYKSYSYSTPAIGDYYLHAPVRPNSKLYYDIQSIIFYYGEPAEP